jgi:hypothetical protein
VPIPAPRRLGRLREFGGAVATEGGLVFYGDIEGYLNG